MRKINLADFGSGSQKLQQEDLKGEFAILTIASVEQRTVTDNERNGAQRDVLVLRFRETGDKTLWLNWAKEIKLVVGQLSNDVDAWPGRQVPVERVTREYNGTRYDKVAIADPAKWSTLFEQAAAAPELEEAI